MRTKIVVAVTVVLGFLLCAAGAQAQATANYAFATNVSGTFTDMSSGTTTLVPAGSDDTASLLTNIGFDFVFMGTRFTQFGVSSNGYLRLGAAPSTTQYALATGTLPLITPFGSDLITSNSGKVHFKVTGSAPNRVLTVEWLNQTIIYDGLFTTVDGTYQLRLYETTGAIEAVYGAMNRNTSTGFSAAMNPQYVGFSTTTTAFHTVNFGTNTANTTVTAFANQATLGAPIPNLNTPVDGSRRLYSFTPPLPNAPTALNFTAVGPLAMTLNWTDSSNELSYLIYRSTDGVNYSFDGTAALNATSYIAGGLVPNTTYFWRVFAISEGGVSTSLSGSQATTAGGNVNSTAAGGLWSSTATWVGGVLPANTDNVTIVDGATVTIDTAAVALTVTVGTGGAASLLRYDTAAARTLTVGSNVTIGSNGTLQSGATGTVTTHALSVGGNLTNNGVLDFSTNANTAGAAITFTSATSNTFSGPGATTDIRTITMNKGAQTAILEINTTNFTVQGVATDVAAWCTITSGTLKLSGTFAGTNRILTPAAYSIPAAGGLWLNNPNYTVAGQNGSPTVTGLLRVSQGTLNIGIASGNSMGFAANSTIIVEGGAVNATGKFGVTAAGNTITYTQSAGTITVCTIGNATSNLASFDLGTNASSVINMSGGAIIAPLASTAVTPIDYRMQAGAGPGSITGGTLQLGNAASGAAKTFNLRGILPTTTVTNTSANHNATMGAISTYNHAAMGSVTFGGTFNAGTSFFLMFGPAFTNNGTLTHNGPGSRFFFTGSVPQTYAGTGVVSGALTSVEVDNPGNLTVTSTNQLVTSRVNLFTGGIINANKVTLGNGTTAAIVQIGNGGPPGTAAGVFDVPPVFNLGTSVQNIFYGYTTTPRTTGNEVNPTRIVSNLNADDADPTHALTIAGGDLTVNGVLTIPNERIITGANTLILGTAGTVARTLGHVDGNFRKPIAAAGAVTFEVGTANGYSPVNFNVTAGSFPTTATIAAVQSAAPGIQPAAKVLSRYWKLNASGITTDITFNYLDPPDVPGTVTEANLKVFRHGIANPSDYSDQGGTINTGANTATVTGVSSFSDWTLAEAGADLAITKTDGVATATPGGSVTYTITASNNGAGANPTSTVVDNFPSGLTCSTTCVGAGGGVCTSGPFAGNINDLASIPSGGSVTYTSTCSVDSNLTGSISNTATVSGGVIADSFAPNNSATDTDTLAASADLGVTKTDGVTTVTAGGSTTYTITASNAGPSAVSGATVADTFPASLSCTWTCVGAGGGTCTASGSGNLNDSVNLPAGGSVTYTASCTISGTASGSLINTATVAAPGGVTDPTPGNNSATDTDTITANADLSITKTDGVATATAGTSVTYTITASNAAGPSTATVATVADTFPASLSCTWTCAGTGGGTCTASGSGNINDSATLPSGGSVIYTAICSISGTASGSLINTATVGAPAGLTDSNPTNNSATDTDTLDASADLSITKTDGVTTATPGGSTTYTITASNSGPSTATNATVADTFPATLTCTWTCAGVGGGTCTASGSGNINDSATLPSGGSAIYTASCTISGAATGSLSNTATVAAPGGVTDPTPGNNSATDTDTLAASADLGITKTDGVVAATPGGSTTYTITASNAGPSNATGATVADTFPASLTCTWTCSGLGGGTCTGAGAGNINDSVNLPSGGSVTYIASCTISGAASGSLSNTATVAAPGGVTDPSPANNSATDTDTLGASADLAITKTDGVAAATAGGSTTYTITASNAGPSNATGATVADTFPASLTCTWTCSGLGGGTCTGGGAGNINDTVNLPSGGSVTYIASCTISPSASGSLSNTATVAAPGGVTDSNPTNNSATDTDTLSASANLGITKTDGVAAATPGGSTTYTITASNAGPSNATGATVADTFPASLTCTWTCSGLGGGTCTGAGAGNINDTVNLPSGGSVTYIASCTISASASGSLSNTATVAAPGGVTDPSPANNSATDTDTLSASADLGITKTDGVVAATPGGSTTYTITASNAGPSNATGATVADTFPASLTCTWTCSGLGGGTCTGAGAGNINDMVNLPSGGSVTYIASCTISGAASGSLSNTATVAAPGGVTDPSPANNSATDTDTLGASADLGITKTDGVVSATPGGSTTYTITASNAGPSNATGTTVADTFPASLTCTWTCSGLGGGTCTGAGAGNINDTVNLPSGGSVTYIASCTISASASGSLSNTATVAAPGGVTDPSPANNSATDTDTLGPNADLSITKTDGVVSATPGGSTTYTITASNAGPSNATGATVADTFPASLTCTWTCAGVAGGTCTGAGSGNINDTVNLPSGGSVIYTAACTISGSASGSLSNTATVAAPGGVTDSNPGNNSATDTDTLAASADLAITKGDAVTSVSAGGSTTYTIIASNAGPSNATGATVADTFPASLTCTWTCTGAGGGTCTASGSGNINDSVNLPSGGSVIYTAACTISGAASGSLSNTATIAAPGGVTDPNPGNNSATDTDSISAAAGAAVSGTKTVSGTFTVGSSVTYTITLTNNGTGAQPNNPGNELTDVLPAQLALVSATATSGTAVASVGTNTVTWNGSIGAGSSVTITIHATILPNAVGTTVTNQGTISYDSDGNGTNDATAQTDDPSAGGSANATGFVIAPAAAAAIPTLPLSGLLFLALTLAATAIVILKRQ